MDPRRACQILRLSDRHQGVGRHPQGTTRTDRCSVQDRVKRDLFCETMLCGRAMDSLCIPPDEGVRSRIKSLFKTLNIPAPKLSDNWGNLLKPMDDQIKKNPPDRHGEWAKQPAFFDHATNDVRAIKRAWRDPTMHVETNYDESGARKALDAVTSFFIHISGKLDQDGIVHAKPVVFPTS